MAKKITKRKKITKKPIVARKGGARKHVNKQLQKKKKRNSFKKNIVITAIVVTLLLLLSFVTKIVIDNSGNSVLGVLGESDSKYNVLNKSTLKVNVSIDGNDGYYVTKIWVKDPYKQIKKLDPMVALTGSPKTDDEIDGIQYSRKRMTINNMLKGYLNNYRYNKIKTNTTKKTQIAPSQNIIAINVSTFCGESIDTTTTYWCVPVDNSLTNLTSTVNTWFVKTDDKVIRNFGYFYDWVPDDREIKGTAIYKHPLFGINNEGMIQNFYPTKTINKKIVANDTFTEVKDAGVKNTFTVNSKNPYDLNDDLNKDGTVRGNNTDKSYMQAMCQINKNNFVFITSIAKITEYTLKNALKNNGCTKGSKLDSGGSVSLLIKKANKGFPDSPTNEISSPQKINFNFFDIDGVNTIKSQTIGTDNKNLIETVSRYGSALICRDFNRVNGVATTPKCRGIADAIYFTD